MNDPNMSTTTRHAPSRDGERGRSDGRTLDERLGVGSCSQHSAFYAPGWLAGGDMPVVALWPLARALAQAREPLTCRDFGGEGGARTHDPRIMSPLL